MMSLRNTQVENFEEMIIISVSRLHFIFINGGSLYVIRWF